MKNVLGDLQIVVEKHSDVLRNNALPFRILILIRIIGFLLSPFATVYGFLSLTPLQLFTIEIWRIVTSVFVGKNIILLGWTMFSLHFGTNLVRQANTNESILKTFAVTQVISTLLVAVLAVLAYVMFNATYFVYEFPVVDMVAINACVVVLIKQFLPDSIVLTTPFGRVKYTHLPMCVIFLSVLGSILQLFSWVVVLQVIAGIQVSWTYLRFFNPHETDAVYGDSSEHFTWASMFPRFVQPLCTVMGRICFRSLVRLGVCKRQVRLVDLHSLQTVPLNLPGLESSFRDAERRRQKALRDLNDRMAKNKQVEQIQWDEDEDSETVKTAEATTSHNEVIDETAAVDTQPVSSDV